MLIIGFIVVLLQILDVSAGDTWALYLSDRLSYNHTLLYTVIVVLTIAIQAFLLIISTRLFIRKKKISSSIGLFVASLYLISQIIIIILLTYLLGEQLLFAKYHKILLETVVGFSLIPSILIMISLALACLKTYSSARNKTVAIYGLSIIILSAHLAAVFLYVENSLFTKPEYITPGRNPWASAYYTTFQNQLQSTYEITKAVSFIAVLVATVLLTKSFSSRTGKIKYWIIVSIPVIYFLLQYSPNFIDKIAILNSMAMTEGSMFPYFQNFVLNTSNVGAGILFGISFFIISRSLMNARLKYYLIICGTGIMILFSSNISTILILATFPAWALISITFVLSASFFTLIGLDSTTFYVANDMSLRSYLNRHRKDLEIFKVFSSAEVSANVEQKVNKISKIVNQEIGNETLFSGGYESEDVKHYVMEVISELRKSSKSDNGKPDGQPDNPDK